MKLPRLLTFTQAWVLGTVALVIAVLLHLFAPVAIAVLVAAACLLGLYGVILKWAPEFVRD